MNLKKKISKTLSFLAYLKRSVLQMPHYGFKGLKAFIYGFTPNKAELYDDLFTTKINYITDYERYVLSPYINYEFKHLFNDKLINYFFLSKYTDKICPIIYYIDYDGGAYPISNNLELVSKYVYKPNQGWGGKGIKIKNGVDSLSDFKNYIVVPYVTNHPYAKKIYPNSLNTIRVLTCFVDNNIEIIASVHRFGTDKTGGIDNFTGGGISCNVDVMSGVIDNVVMFEKNRKVLVESHPDSNEQIKGIEIPNWTTMTNELKELHLSINFVKYIGWDIAVTNEEWIIIEANHVSDLDLIQCHSGVLKEDKVKRFYKLNLD